MSDPTTLKFGTDGVRGEAGRGVLVPANIERLGVALADWLAQQSPADRSASGGVLIGGDTRESTPWIKDALARGLARRGRSTIDLGVLPTAAIALLAPRFGASCAVVISASHNPSSENGIKVFGSSRKLDDAGAAWIERRYAEIGNLSAQAVLLRTEFHPEGADYYLDHLRREVPALDLRKVKIALDLSNGAAYSVGPALFQSLGAVVECVGDRPDGRNINLDCGSQLPERLQALVGRGGFRFGLAVDGDADRSIFVDERGALVDGDGVLALVAQDLLARGALPGRTVVGTVMTNYGLELFLAARGMKLERTPVGDRFISARLRDGNFALGGEPSGHVIFGGDLGYLGDGLYTALRVAEILARRGRTLSAELAELVLMPQVLEGVRVRSRPPLEGLFHFRKKLALAEKELDGKGRIVVRYSGTEPLLRVMVEGQDRERVRAIAKELAQTAQQEIESS